jgi:protein-S-isoprenylcysteine O-methyltransferase Ste14
MLALAFVQASAGIALVATSVGFAVGLGRRLRSGPPGRLRAARPPAGGTQLLWLLGTLVAIFWGVGAFVAPSYAYYWPAFADFPGSSAVQLLGVGLSIAGGILYSRSARALGAPMTPNNEVREGDRIVEAGPYGRIRHPIYVAIVAIALGQTFLFLSVPMAALTVLLIGLAVYRAGLEERMLRTPEAFGAQYDAYAARTGAFVPRRAVPR